MNDPRYDHDEETELEMSIRESFDERREDPFEMEMDLLTEDQLRKLDEENQKFELL